MPSVSNMARVEAIREELLSCKRNLKEGYHSKSAKEELLRSIRELEAALEIEGRPYNNGKGI